MRKYILPVICIVITTFFIVFANIKAREAARLEDIATRATELAERSAEEARRMEEIATERAAEAMREHNRADILASDLEECQTRKK